MVIYDKGDVPFKHIYFGSESLFIPFLVNCIDEKLMSRIIKKQTDCDNTCKFNYLSLSGRDLGFGISGINTTVEEFIKEKKFLLRVCFDLACFNLQ